MKGFLDFSEEKKIMVKTKMGGEIPATIKMTGKDYHIVKTDSGKQYRVDHKGNSLEEDIDLEEAKKEDPPFEPDTKKTKPSTPGKYGSAYSNVRHLARQALQKQAKKKVDELNGKISVSEELDEISSTLAGNYYGAATKKHIAKVGIKPNMYDRIEKDMGKQRKAGVDRALDRVTGIKRATSKMSEEVEIDEGVLKNVKRVIAGKDIKSRVGQEIAKAQDANMKGDHKTSAKHFYRFDKLDKLMTKEQVELDEANAMQIASAIEAYAKKHGGIDKNDMMKVASMLKKGDMKGAEKYTMSLDSDPRDFLLSKMGFDEEVDGLSESYEEAEKHLSLANDADAKGDKASFHAHMADHHDSLSEWHDSKGRSASADKHAKKADFHHEKSLDNSHKESVDLEERNKENAMRRKTMDASRGARYKLSNPVSPAEPEHKTSQAHNKAIGRALRNEEDDLDEAHQVVAKTKEGETFKSAVYPDKKQAMDMHYKMAKGNKYAKVDIVKVQEEVDLEEQAPVAPSIVKHRIGVKVSSPDSTVKKVKFVKVPHSENKEGAKAVAEKHFKKKGYTVHSSYHAGVMNEETDTSEKLEMAETQLHFIKYASEEILDYIKMGGDIEEWYQNKLSKVHSDMEGLHSWVEGEKRRTEMVKEDAVEESSIGWMLKQDPTLAKKVKDKTQGYKDLKKWAGKPVPKKDDAKGVTEETLDEEHLVEFVVKHDGVDDDNPDETRRKLFAGKKNVVNHMTKYKNSAESRAELLKRKGFKNVRIEELVGKQHKVDKNKNGKIDAHDFKLLRKEDAEQIEETLMPSEPKKASVNGRKGTVIGQVTGSSQKHYAIRFDDAKYPKDTHDVVSHHKVQFH